MRRLKKAVPGEGTETKAEQFSYTRTQPGLKGVWYAWCAHEPYWCKVHEHTEKTPGTKVCLTWATDSALRCPRCRPGVVPTTVAYVPVWRELDLAPCMVIVHEGTADRLAGVEFGTYVMVSCVEQKGGVCLTRAAEQRRWNTSLPYRQSPCDIAVSLLTMWGYPQYTDWLSRQSPPSGVVVEKVPGAERWRLSVPPPTTDAEALAVDAHRDPPTTDASGIGDALKGALSRAQKAERNGKHDKKEGE